MSILIHHHIILACKRYTKKWVNSRQNSQNGPKLRVFYAKKYTTAGCVVVTNISYGCPMSSSDCHVTFTNIIIWVSQFVKICHDCHKRLLFTLEYWDKQQPPLHPKIWRYAPNPQTFSLRQKSKHLKGQLGPHIIDVTFF